MRERTKAKKSLGQNFLSDPALLESIVLFAGVLPGSKVLEIGPGRGALTEALLGAGAEVLALEADRDLIPFLEKRFHSTPKLSLREGDILRTPLSEFYQETEAYQVVANIPYYITAPIIKKLLTERPVPKRITLLVQKEVAERLSGRAKERSVLSVATWFYSQVQLGPVIPKEYFDPVPKVDSQLVTFTPRRAASESDRFFFQVVRAGFAARRKTLFNNIKAARFVASEDLTSIFAELHWDIKRRAQDLEVAEWEALVQKLLPEKNNQPQSIADNQSD